MARMKADELISEYEWLTSNGVHPLLAVQQLGKRPGTFARFLARYGRLDLATALWGE